MEISYPMLVVERFQINVSTNFVAATFRLRHSRSGKYRSGYRLWFVIVFWNRSTRDGTLGLFFERLGRYF